MAISRTDKGEHVFLVAYDISDTKRWRQVFRTMKGYGFRLQLSVWQCRLSGVRRVQMAMDLDVLIDQSEDVVAIFDLGSAENVDVKVETLSRDTFVPIERRANIV